MTPAIGRDHNVPAEDASVKLIPIDDPVPNQVQVKVKDNAPRDHSENRRGIACWYPAASSSRASLLAEAFEGVSAKLLMVDSQAQIVFAGRIEHFEYPGTATKTLYEDPSRKRLSITRACLTQVAQEFRVTGSGPMRYTVATEIKRLCD